MEQMYSCLQFHVVTDVLDLRQTELGWLHGKVMFCHRASLIWNRNNQSLNYEMTLSCLQPKVHNSQRERADQELSDVSYFHSYNQACKGKPNSPPSQEEYRKKKTSLFRYGINTHYYIVCHASWQCWSSCIFISTEDTFGQASIWEILCLWNCSFGIVTTYGRCAVVFWTNCVVCVFGGLYCLKIGFNTPYSLFYKIGWLDNHLACDQPNFNHALMTRSKIMAHHIPQHFIAVIVPVRGTQPPPMRFDSRGRL